MHKRLMALSLALALVATASVSSTRAQNILEWNTAVPANTGLETTENSTFNAVGVLPSNLTLGMGITAAANGNRFGGNAYFDTGDPSPTDLPDAVSDNEYIEFNVTLSTGTSYTATGFNFIWDRSSTGASAVTLQYSTDGFATAGTFLASATGLAIGNTTVFTNLDFNHTSTAVTTTYRLYGYGATGATGTGGFESTNLNANPNVIFEGTVVPEPATVIGGLLGLCGLCWHQRRRVGRLLHLA